jgi:hypothetical protein
MTLGSGEDTARRGGVLDFSSSQFHCTDRRCGISCRSRKP